MIRKLILPLLCLLLATNSYAGVNGGEIRYEYDSLDYYRVYLTIYYDCGMIGIPTDSQLVKLVSSCSTDSMWVHKTGPADTTYRTWCPAVSTYCGTNGVVRIYHYSGVAHLPACSDWVISYVGPTLNVAIGNLANAGSVNLYLEAGLDNSTAINTNSLMANDPPFYPSMYSYQSIPLQATDADGDSIEYIFSQPPAPYFIGWQPATPPFDVDHQIPHYSVLDNSSQMLYELPDLQGVYYMCIRANEYRNANITGYRTRAWTSVFANSTTDPEIPLPAVGTQFVYTTHPGETDTITLNFNDSTVTDSVFANFQAASYPNITTTASSAPGVGSGSATLIFSTPANFNVADSPYVNMRVYVHDNACDLQGYAYYNVLLYIAQPNADSVWPGDANGDHVVNMNDPLAISVAYNNTGVVRTGANLSWTAQYCTDWATNFVNGINHKHADCNGDGTVDYTDTLAVTANYGLTHPKESGHAAKASGLPDLKFDNTGITFSAGTTVTVPLKLGDATMMMNNVYGVASNIKIQGLTLATAPSFSYGGSWIGNAVNTLHFRKELGNANIDWVYSRTDHQNISGQGTIGTMTFTVPASANVGDMIIFHLSNSKIIDKNGNDVTGYNVVDDTVYVQFPVAIGEASKTMMFAAIVPNPSKDKATLQVTLSSDESILLSVTDITGRKVQEANINAVKGTNMVSLPVLAKGIYVVQLQSADGDYKQSIKWVQEP